VDNALRRTWEQIQETEEVLASPFFSPHYATAAASVWPRIQIGILVSDSMPVGFFPFERRGLGLGRPAAYGLTDFQGVVARRGLQWTAAELMRGCKMHALEFNHLVASQIQFRQFHRRLGRSPYIDLSEGYERYREGQRKRGSEQIKKLEGLGRKLEREVGPLRFTADEPDVGTLTWLVERKSEQCRELGYTDALARPDVRQFVEMLLQLRLPTFGGILSTLRAGDRLVAAHFGLRSAAVWHYWFPAYDPAIARYSPGLLLLLAMVRGAPLAGVRRIDLGKGDAPYKDRLMNGHWELADALAMSGGPAGLALRTALRARKWMRTSSLAAPARTLRRLIQGR
jgi:CelD/BcsL family acetyltransferase involved in cellulose biosynthesis